MKTEEPIEAFPLDWPGTIRRTAHPTKAPFTQTVKSAQDGLLRELRLLGATDIIISSDVGPRKQDGTLYARATTTPADKGVAVYFKRKGKAMCFACDRYDRVHHNIHAIALTIGAIRGIERWGSSEMADMAFTGFAQLPQSTTRKWWEVLGVSPSASESEVEAAYRRLTLVRHPDVGGTHEAMAELNLARDDWRKGR